MSHRVAVRSDEQILELQHYGDVDADEAKEAVDLAARFVQRFKLGRILIDLTDAAVTITEAELDGLKQLLLRRVPPSMRIAVLSPRSGWIAPNRTLVEEAAADSDGRHHVFDDRDTALAWLTRAENHSAVNQAS